MSWPSSPTRVVLAGIGGGLSLLRKRPPVAGVLIGAAIGWILGAWGGADLGDGSILTSVVATLPAALLIGARLGLSKNLDYAGRIALDAKSRATIFVGPALLFIFVTPGHSRHPHRLPLAARSGLGAMGRPRQLHHRVHRPQQPRPRELDLDVHQHPVPHRGRRAAHRPHRRHRDETDDRLRRRDRKPDDGPTDRRAPAPLVRCLHRTSGHDHQQHVVGRRCHLRVDGDGTGHRRLRRSAGRRAGGKIDRLHADGHLAGRRLDHLAVRLRRPRHLHRADRCTQLALGRSRPAVDRLGAADAHRHCGAHLDPARDCS